MTDTAEQDAEVATYWWITHQRPIEADEDNWTYCCSGESRTSNPQSLAVRHAEEHHLRAEILYRTTVYDNMDHKGDPLATAYNPDVTITAKDAGLIPPAVTPQGGPSDAEPDDLSDHPDHPDNAPPKKITSLEDLVRHFMATTSAPGYDPALGYRSPDLAIDIDSLPEDLRDGLRLLLSSGNIGVKVMQSSPVENALMGSANRINNHLYFMMEEIKTNRPGTVWGQHPDMLNTMAKLCVDFLDAWSDWKIA